MKVHKNARLPPRSRAELVRRVLVEGRSPKAVATASGVDAKTAAKWVDSFEAEGAEGLKDRSSRPHRLHQPTPPQTVEQVVAPRRQRFRGRQIAKQARVSPTTVSQILRAASLSRARTWTRRRPWPATSEHPGELILLDIKKLGRFEKPGHRVTGDRTGQSNSRDAGLLGAETAGLQGLPCD